MKRKHLLSRFGLISLALSSPAVAEPTKDEIAYNYVFDRLGKIFPGTPTENIHLLNVLVPATWANADDEDAAYELQTLAGAIPDNLFALDPSRMKQQLHQIYAAYLSNVEFPPVNKLSEDKLSAAEQEYADASEALDAKRAQFTALWDVEEAKLKAAGKPITIKTRQHFQAAHAGIFAAVNNRLDRAMREIQKYSPVNASWVTAARLMHNEVIGVSTNGSDVYSYRGGEATLKSIGADCLDDNSKGWEGFTFDQSTNSQSLRTSNWNASGGWSSGFFGASLGGGSSSFDNLVKTSSDSVSLQFCKLTYIHFAPGAWFDVTFLQALDQGTLKLKPGSLNYGKPIFGAKGTIPYLVKGAIVARRLAFNVHSDSTVLHDVQTQSSGGGGFHVGGWHLGGAGGSVKFDHDFKSDAGSYGRSTAMDVPVIIAIITEPTVGSGDQPNTQPAGLTPN